MAKCILLVNHHFWIKLILDPARNNIWRVLKMGFLIRSIMIELFLILGASLIILLLGLWTLQRLALNPNTIVIECWLLFLSELILIIRSLIAIGLERLTHSLNNRLLSLFQFDLFHHPLFVVLLIDLLLFLFILNKFGSLVSKVGKTRSLFLMNLHLFFD